MHTDISLADLAKVSESCHGYVGADVQLSIREALLQCIIEQKKVLELQNLQYGVNSVKPSALREVVLQVPNVRWNDIGGQHRVKQRLQEVFELSLLHAEKLEALQLTPTKGILLFGPPGCSKTLLAKALATESSRNFLAVKGPEIFSQWVGDSEKAIREIFRKARLAAPSIVFFDEIDSIAARRGSTNEVTDRVLSQLLIELDGVEPLANVTVLAATNRPDMIDPALLRPGRIDQKFYIPPPDHEAVKEIFTIKFKRTIVDPDVYTQVDLLAARSVEKSLTGAEVCTVVHNAAILAMRENFQAPHIALRHLLCAVDALQPQLTPAMLQFYQQF